MISEESRSIDWIQKVSTENNAPDTGLVEKTIRAFCLLESLALSGLDFIFKGGSSLMLHFGTSRRLSIDVDIVCKPGTDIEKYIKKYAGEYGFNRVELVDRISRTMGMTHKYVPGDPRERVITIAWYALVKPSEVVGWGRCRQGRVLPSFAEYYYL